jgi:ParB family transcriptional regulator, chromosome partitioning protein
MRLPWNRNQERQLDLLEASGLSAAPAKVVAPSAAKKPGAACDGRPLMLAIDRLVEDPDNPRTEFPEAERDELAEDIRQRGVLQPIVVRPADAQGLHRIHFGAKRYRGAIHAGLTEVPVVVREIGPDPYAQVAENQKRHGLTPLDLARFIRGRVDAGKSNSDIARRLGMNLTTVAHHLSLLVLPPELAHALKSGRCTSPRALHELAKLHEQDPAQVQTLLVGGCEISRASISRLREVQAARPSKARSAPGPGKLIANARTACNRLEQALNCLNPLDTGIAAHPEFEALRNRVECLTKHWLPAIGRHAVCAVGQAAMAGASRDRVTIDLRVIGDAVRGTAAARGMGVAQLVRRALVESLDLQAPVGGISESDGQTPGDAVTKMTLRLPQSHAEALALGATTLGLSYGEYVAKLVGGGRLPQPCVERAADRAALLDASDKLAMLSTDLNAFVRLLGAGKRAEAEPYRDRIRFADAEVKRQLDRMAKFLDAV